MLCYWCYASSHFSLLHVCDILHITESHWPLTTALGLSTGSAARRERRMGRGWGISQWRCAKRSRRRESPPTMKWPMSWWLNSALQTTTFPPMTQWVNHLQPTTVLLTPFNVFLFCADMKSRLASDRPWTNQNERMKLPFTFVCSL